MLLYAFSGVPMTPYVEVNNFPELNPLRENWKLIRDEAKQLLTDEKFGRADTHNDLAFNSFFQRGWRRFYITWYNSDFTTAEELCPKTTQLIKSIPSVKAALFALLPPGARLGAHRDPLAISLRYHLGLVTPNSDDCRIYVDGQPYAWRDGEDVIFDETYIHEVHNESDQTRIILFCDIERPIRNPIVRALNRFISKRVVKATTAQNTCTDKVGAINRISRYPHLIRSNTRGIKESHRNIYLCIKYGFYLAILYWIYIW